MQYISQLISVVFPMSSESPPPSFSIRIDSDIDNSNNNDSDTESLRTRILNIVKSSKDYTIRPAKVSNELGISINDASAELCGLLKAVGKGSSFTFQTLDNGVNTMVFVFPPDFEKKAMASQRNEAVGQTFHDFLEILIKVVKVLTAFGLIISTVIVSIAGMVALVAALVALSRGGGDSRNARHTLTRQLYNLFYSVRQLIWCYAMFGPTTGDDQDPFFREAAYDTWLVLSLCCGNPGSMWFWFRARALRQRRRRFARGWGHHNTSNYDDSLSSDLEGISLIRRGSWGEELVPASTPSSDDHPDDHRGLLSAAVEFLFGPNAPSGPSEEERWKLRGAVIADKSISRNNGPISLQEFAPFVDSPPSSWDDTTRIVSEGLLIVAHFNGKPAGRALDEIKDLSKASFDFPELLAESRFATHYSGREGSNEDTDLFYINESSTTLTPPRNTTDRYTLPQFLYEERKMLTKLTAKQFYHCLFVAVLNLIGVIWFAQALEIGGILEQSLGSSLVTALKRGLIPVLLFYSKLFFSIPTVRLLYILGWNRFCKNRNHRRRELATLLLTEQ